MKICSKCLKEKDLSMFYRDRTKKDGFRPDCKPCSKLGIDMENRRSYEAEYRSKNAEYRRKIVRESHDRNKEHHKQVRRDYLKTDAGKSMYRKQTQKRYAMRKSAFVEDVSPIDLFNEQSGVCYLCSNKFSFSQMELDHVYPIAKGGKHEKKNCKMACVSCNRSKGSKTLEEMIYPVV